MPRTVKAQPSVPVPRQRKARTGRHIKVREIDQILRQAIWESHGKKCVYEGEPIMKLSDMEIDHILPLHLWEGGRIPLGILKKLGLDADYHPNSLDNLLPASKQRNRQKGKWIFNENNVRFFRELAAKQAEAIESRCAQYQDQAFQEKIRTQAQAACSTNPKLRATLVQALQNTPPFPTEDFVGESEVRFSRSRVSICCQLPGFNCDGTALIQINALYLHNVQFKFEEPEILRVLFRGWRTPFGLRQRGFTPNEPKTTGPENIVVLGGTTLYLTDDELTQLCGLVDLIVPHYLGALIKREREDGTLLFAPDGRRNVRLITVKRELWKAILEFSREHDYADGKSRWYVFDAHGHGHIKIVRRTPDGDIVPFETYIYPALRDTMGPLIHNEEEVSLCWDESSSRIHTRNQDDDSRGWTAEDAACWLTEELIPAVVRRTTSRRRTYFRQMRKPWQRSSYYEPTWGVDEVLFREIDSWETLVKVADVCQTLFIDHSHEPVARTVVESALTGIELLAKLVPQRDDFLGYIAEKLRVDRETEVGSMVENGKKQMLAQREFSASDVDHLLRCGCALLDDNNKDRSSLASSFTPVVEAWTELIRTARFEVIRHRTLERIEQPASR